MAFADNGRQDAAMRTLAELNKRIGVTADACGRYATKYKIASACRKAGMGLLLLAFLVKAPPVLLACGLGGVCLAAGGSHFATKYKSWQKRSFAQLTLLENSRDDILAAIQPSKPAPVIEGVARHVEETRHASPVKAARARVYGFKK